MRRNLKTSLALIAILGVQSAAIAQNTPPGQPAIAPEVVVYPPLSESDAAGLRTALSAARTGNVSGTRSAMQSLSDPVARKIALWALVDANPTSLSFLEADSARRDLAGWPREAARQQAAERSIERAGYSPANIIAWFDGAKPATAEGALALASAYRGLGRSQEANDLVRDFWRNQVFELEAQRAILAQFSDVLTADDHIRRADILLYGAQGPAARAMIDLLPEDYKAAANARIALRGGTAAAARLVAALPESLANSPGVAFERASLFQRRGQEDSAVSLLAYLPKPPPTVEAEAKVWLLRKQLIVYLIRQGQISDAYVAADAALTTGADAAEAEFYAGWLSLQKMANPARAALHFANIGRIGRAPITVGRALYWQGRAAEAQGDPIGAQLFYTQGAEHQTTFYGQLAAEKAGRTEISLGADPAITPADTARFEGREAVRAARILAQIGARDTFRIFVLAIDDVLPNAEEAALLVDLARYYGDVDLGMRAARTAAQRGFELPERGYPFLNNVPQPAGGADLAFVHSISRQESNFDPLARSSVGARGMMQLMPETATTVARRLGMPYSAERLNDGVYNMTLGSAYLGDMVDTFRGSYPMAAAAYNAGPGRPTQWATYCGDPRGGQVDPVDFIECIPFSETRNYVMRALETMMVYRARLNGGRAPLTLSADLRRG